MEGILWPCSHCMFVRYPTPCPASQATAKLNTKLATARSDMKTATKRIKELEQRHRVDPEARA